jgi:hypothetical protein
MNEHPILFNREMILALHAGRKTQTRRIVNPAPIADDRFIGGYKIAMPKSRYTGMQTGGEISVEAAYVHTCCPYGSPGDRLWVREAWRVSHKHDYLAPRDLPFERGMTIMYGAGGSRAHNAAGEYVNDPCYPLTLPAWAGKGRPSIHMPRAASRTTLEITGVRVERLQDISEADAEKEGVNRLANGSPYWRNYVTSRPDHGTYDYTCLSARESFSTLWDSINEARGFGWETNPWLWVVDFSSYRGT